MTSAEAKRALETYHGRALRIMEVCGTHTHEIFRLGLRQLLPSAITLVSGPGCPVCVTPVSYIDEAIALALDHHAIITTFGDLVRVPGSRASLANARQQGADIRIVYSPLDALDIATKTDKEVVFLSVGFETTAPAECLAVREAHEKKIPNFSLLTANKTMPMAYEALVGSCDAFLYPGHVMAITGTAVGEDLAARGVSGVVAGFTADDLLYALATLCTRLCEGTAFFANCYPRVVRNEGNPKALALLKACMEACDSEWRGLGCIPKSGLALVPSLRDYDARIRFALPPQEGKEHPQCRCGAILRGQCTPPQCPLYGRACTPEHPIGACMVSSEGTCAAYYQYGGL